MGGLFADLGYQAGPSIRDPSAGEVRAVLGDWLASVQLSNNDALVIYYSGHGAIAGGAHYLCTRGCDVTRVGATAFKTEDFLELVVRRRDRPGKLWLILDCCQAGGVLGEGLCRGILGEQIGVFVLAASASWGQAVDGAFSAAMQDALGAIHLSAATTPAGLSLDSLTHELNGRRLLSSRVVQAGVSSCRFDLLAPPRPAGKPPLRLRRPPLPRSAELVLWLALAVVALVGTPCTRSRGTAGHDRGHPQLFQDRQETDWRATRRRFPHRVVLGRRSRLCLLRERGRCVISTGNASSGI
jgi:hypothetical protein